MTLSKIILLMASAGTLLAGPQPAKQSLVQQLKSFLALRQVKGDSITAVNTKCGFNDIAALLTHRGSLTDQERAVVRALTTRPELQKSILSPDGLFRIHYDTTGINTPSLSIHRPSGDSLIQGSYDAYADSVGAIFDYVWHREIDGMGYPPPPSDGGLGGDNAYDIYIQQSGYYGETIADTIGAQTSTSCITIDNNFAEPMFYTRGLNAARVTAAHEFFHAIQIGNYRMYGIGTESPFFFEISSTWMEDEIYPEVKDYLEYLRGSAGEFMNTNIPLNQSNGSVEYGRAIFAKFLVKEEYGVSIMHDIWMAMIAVPSLEAIIQTLQQYHTSLESEYPEFALWHYYTGSRADSTKYFPDGALYPEVKIFDQITFIPPVSQSNYTSRHLAFQYYQVVNLDTATMLATNVNIASALNGLANYYPFTYIVRNDASGGNYTRLSNGWSILFQAPDPQNWKSIEFLNSSVPISPDIRPYPNPFIADGGNSIAFPLPAASQDAELEVYSSDLREIYHGRQQARLKLGSAVIQWDGAMTNGILTPSGVYYYVLNFNGGTTHGKIAILRK